MMISSSSRAILHCYRHRPCPSHLLKTHVSVIAVHANYPPPALAIYHGFRSHVPYSATLTSFVFFLLFIAMFQLELSLCDVNLIIFFFVFGITSDWL